MVEKVGSLEGRIAVVTGSSRGIGRAIAELLAQRGASVVVNYRANQEAADEAVAGIVTAGGRALAVQADVSKCTEIAKLFDQAEEAFGPLDIVVASAGTAVIKPAVECDEGDFDLTFDTNAKGAFFTMREGARRLRDGGRIIAISTGGTRMWFTDTSLYLGSKAAVEQFVRAFSRELGQRQITVNAVLPGYTDTDLLPERDHAVAVESSPLGRLGRPIDVAETVAFLASRNADWITGQAIGAGGGVM